MPLLFPPFDYKNTFAPFECLFFFLRVFLVDGHPTLVVNTCNWGYRLQDVQQHIKGWNDRGIALHR